LTHGGACPQTRRVIREHRRPRESVAAPPSPDREAAGRGGHRQASGASTGTPDAWVPEDVPGADAAAASVPAKLPAVSFLGLDRRRLAWALAAIVAAWILFTFARQVGEAADASARAERARAANATLAAELDRLRAELQLIQEPRYIALQARAFGVGGRGERQFTLEAGAPTLPPDAPGSASKRIGYREVTRTPLEAWIQLLFGPPAGG
jgi:cell division protein FtsB